MDGILRNNLNKNQNFRCWEVVKMTYLVCRQTHFLVVYIHQLDILLFCNLLHCHGNGYLI